jgi:flagellar secretion chaperone FliS
VTAREGFAAYRAASIMMDTEDKPKILLATLKGIIEKLDVAKAAIAQNNFEKKAVELTKIQQVIGFLDGSLDMSQGEIAQKLSAIYSYILKRLSSVHRSLDVAVIDEVKYLLMTILEGFVEAYETERKKACSQSPIRRAITEQISL